jgi:hypothetical protein
MSIQYPKTEHVTLPSVEQWGSNTNILRDPPKSITTRRIDKVFQNTDITNLVDDSGDRICDGINVYARGVNPMVSVSYSNSSNNAGINGNATSFSNRTQARLPYPAFEGGAFRPPILTQRDLLPLSRLPRAWFGTVTTPGFIDFSKTQQRPNDYRAIKELLNIYDVHPNKTANIDKPLVENFKMLNAINDKHMNVTADAGYQSSYLSNYTKENADVYKGINDNSINVFANVNKGQDTFSHNLSGLEIDQNKYIQDHLTYEAFSNISSNHARNLNDIEMNTSKYVQDINSIEAFSNMSSNHARNLNDIEMNTSKYVQDHLTYDAFSNISSDRSVKRLDELYDNGRITTKDTIIQYKKDSGVNPGYTFLNDIAQPVLEMRNPQFEVQSQKSDQTVYRRVDHDNELYFERNTPLTNFRTNITKIEDFNTISSRDYHRLDPLLNKGSFLNQGIKPTIEREDLIHVRESDKDKLRRRINDSQFNRYN